MKKSTSSWMVLIGSVFLVVAIVLLMIFFMHGQTAIIKNEDGIEAYKSISCKSVGKDYPFFVYNDSEKQETAIDVIFAKDDSLSTIALTHTLYYSDLNTIKESENSNRASLDVSFAENNVKSDALSPKHSELTNGYKMSLYADKDKLQRNALKFFLLDELESRNKFQLGDIQRIYNSKGFECVLNNTGNN